MKQKFYLIICILFFKTIAHAGFDVGNGGDILHCPMLNNYFTLDYALTRAGKNKFTARGITSLSDSFQKISNLIDKKLPTLSLSFKEFVSQLENHSDYSKKYIWIASNDLIDIADEHYVDIASACGPNLSGSVDVIQAVIRKKNDAESGSPKTIIFNYDPQALKLIDNSPLQKSYLYVHEWLWNIAKDSNQIRQINSLLHSDQFTSMTQQEVTIYFRRVGIQL
jgi:hypothetical protein